MATWFITGCSSGLGHSLARAAKLIVEAVAKGRLPKRLLLGSDAVTIVRKGLQAQLDEIAAAGAASESTDFPKND